MDSTLITALTRFYRSSFLCRTIAAVAGFFGRLWDDSLFKRLLVSESPRGERTLEGSKIGWLGGKISDLSSSPRTNERFSLVLDSLSRILGGLPFTSSRSFGFALLAFSAAALPFNLSGLWFYALIGALAAGLVLIAVNRSFANMFGSSFFIKLAAGFFGFNEQSGETQPVLRFHAFYAILGVVLGGMFGLLDLTTFIITAGALLGGMLVLYKTEVGVFTAAFLIPIAPTKIILGICAITVASYFIKVLFCRENALPFRLNALDTLALLFGVALCYGVVISYRPTGSLVVSMTYILYILFFIAAKNTLRTKRMVVAALSLLLVSGLLVSMYGVYQKLSGSFVETTAWIDDEMFEEATARIYSTLENPNVLGEYLIFVISAALAALYYFKRPVYKLASLGVLGVSGMCMILTQSRGAWLGLIFAVAVFALMYDRRLVLLGVALIPLLLLFLPETVISRFLSIGSMGDSSTSYRVNIWLACLTMLKTVWLTGIGPGVDSFRFVYQEYAFNAVEAPHSHNLYLQVIIDLGVFGFIILIALLFVFFKYLFRCIRGSGDRFIRAASAGLAAGMFGYLVQGMTDNVWYNYRIVAYFWFILALCGALYGLRGKALDSSDKTCENGDAV